MKKAIFSILLVFAVFSVYAQLTQQEKEEFIKVHNNYRNEQGIAPLVWSDTLEKAAQNWADFIASKDLLAHSTMGYGENIFRSNYKPSPKEVVDSWASEKQYYNGETIDYNNYNLFGHYTQIIWSETKYVGCAYAVSKKGYYYYVCEYSPAGNFVGKKPVKNFKK